MSPAFSERPEPDVSLELRGPTNSVVGLFDASSSPVKRYRYSPWGQAELEVEAVGNPYRYTGRRFDDETGLYHNRARYYDPDIARFISQDPLGLEAGINPYAYAGNDPVNARDPSGLECFWVSGGRCSSVLGLHAGFGIKVTVSNKGGGGGVGRNWGTTHRRGPRTGAVTTVGNLASGIIGGGTGSITMNLINCPPCRRPTCEESMRVLRAIVLRINGMECPIIYDKLRSLYNRGQIGVNPGGFEDDFRQMGSLIPGFSPFPLGLSD